MDVELLTKNGVNVEKSLELFGDMETYNETLNDFLKEVEPKVIKIKDYQKIGDMTNYSILVHSLKSDAKYFGFEKLAELAYDHELKSKANEIFYVNEHFNELMEETDRIINLVKKYMGLSYKETKSKGTTKNDELKRNKAILIVDDSNLIRNFVLANDGEEALNIINDPEEFSRMKAMLLDLNMPNVNGFEVLDYFKKRDLFKKLPVAIITGVDDKESVEKAYSYPIKDILLKPFNEKDIKKTLEKTIEE